MLTTAWQVMPIDAMGTRMQCRFLITFQAYFHKRTYTRHGYWDQESVSSQNIGATGESTTNTMLMNGNKTSSNILFF